MLKTIVFFLVVTAPALAQSPPNDQAQIWNLEKAYWEYVKINDLEKYRALWHDDFVGWPLVNAAPVQKDQITAWITNNTSKGLVLQSYALEQLAVRITSDVAIDHYRIKLIWAKRDHGEVSRTDALRITHTWIKTNGTWKILSGMSAPVNAEGK